MSEILSPEGILAQEFHTLPELIRLHAAQRPRHIALRQDERTLDYRSLDELADRIAATLQRAGLGPDCTIAICAAMSIEYAAVFIGALRAGIAVAPLAPSSTPAGIASMVADSASKMLFLDASVGNALQSVSERINAMRVALDDSSAAISFRNWL